MVKKDSRDYLGAISDYTTAIQINPKYANAYSNRGIEKWKLGDNSGACKDYKKAISLGNKFTEEWLESDAGAWCRNM